MAQVERTTGDPAFAAPGSGRITNLTAAPGLCLVRLGSNGVEGERYLTRVTRTLIGRSAECDLVLNGETVSRVHAVIRRAANGFLIEDRSRNGTWVNGIRVRERLLRDGDQVRIGPYFLQVELEPARSTNLYPQRDTGSSSLAEAAIPPQLFVRGLEEGVTFSLTGTEVTIGRRPGNDILLEGEKISRDHAVIRREGRSFRLVDLGSANGTHVNGQRIERVELSNGDRIKIGNYDCQVSFRSDDCLLHFRKLSQ